MSTPLRRVTPRELSSSDIIDPLDVLKNARAAVAGTGISATDDESS